MRDTSARSQAGQDENPKVMQRQEGKMLPKKKGDREESINGIPMILLSRQTDLINCTMGTDVACLESFGASSFLLLLRGTPKANVSFPREDLKVAYYPTERFILMRRSGISPGYNWMEGKSSQPSTADRTSDAMVGEVSPAAAARLVALASRGASDGNRSCAPGSFERRYFTCQILGMY
ncbi:hypothetical protein ALC62_12999 [Cyphomyrmex costatus]|uniref:Uncharacterized protein n=1 Tax=Cyphomyrmex costatus TaxID=456900 RepID=A0A195C886_9HYME|nr:hypothetical protein ALC62_12999 [Cyphomyrmex costatus]